MADAEGLLDAREVNEMPSEAAVGKKGWIKGSDHLGWGMKNRLSRLIKPDGRCQFLPIDHGYFQGPTRCLERPAETIRDLVPYADGLFVTRGVLRAAIDPLIQTPIILRVSGGTSVVGKDLADEIITTSVEEMIRLNVAAVGVSIFVGSDYERETLENLSMLVDDCEDYGIPVMAVTAVGKELEKRTARYLALSCRIAAELGAKIVKTYYCNDGFEKVTDGCPVPVVIAGGKKIPEKDALKMARDAIDAGAVGVDMGRNIFQSSDPVAMIQAVRAVVHKGATVKEGLEIFKSKSSKKAKRK